MLPFGSHQAPLITVGSMGTPTPTLGGGRKLLLPQCCWEFPSPPRVGVPILPTLPTQEALWCFWCCGAGGECRFINSQKRPLHARRDIRALTACDRPEGWWNGTPSRNHYQRTAPKHQKGASCVALEHPEPLLETEFPKAAGRNSGRPG